MKAISKKSIHFPGLDWGITAGVPTEMPHNTEAQTIILAHKHIKKVTEAKANK